MEIPWLSQAEKIGSCQSLSCIFYGLQTPITTTIQLKNELKIFGTITGVDAKAK